MPKQYKIILVLLAVAITAILYLIVTSEPVNHFGNDINNDEKKVDLVKLEKSYKEDVKKIFNEYSALIKDADIGAIQLGEIKNRLLDLRVPTDLKDLHINFFLAVLKMENYLQNMDEKERGDSEAMINELKEDYEWLR